MKRLIFLSSIPCILLLLGVNLCASRVGPLVHALLEWTAVIVALVVGALSLVHYRLKQEVITPIVGLSLLVGGTVDAVHTLVATEIIQGVASPEHFLPFTWTLSRSFHLGILVTGVLLAQHARTRVTLRVIAGSGVFLATLAACLTLACAYSASLPIMVFPGSWIPRPWDAALLVAYACAALFLLPAFQQRNSSLFTRSLTIALIPDLALQAHMAFGNVALFDEHFHAAHILKVLAYAVPMAVLFQDYINVHEKSRERAIRLESSNAAIRVSAEQLTESNAQTSALAHQLRQAVNDLEETLRIISHDVKEPLRAIQGFVSLLLHKPPKDLSTDQKLWFQQLIDSVKRLNRRFDSMQQFSAAGRFMLSSGISLEKCLKEARVAIQPRVEELRAAGDDIQITGDTHLPYVWGSSEYLASVFQNLLINSIKHRKLGVTLVVTIEVKHIDQWIEVSVQDNGHGFDPKYDQWIFGAGNRLDAKIDGDGMGLAITRRIVEKHGGHISARGTLGEGVCFTFRLKASDSPSGGYTK